VKSLKVLPLAVFSRDWTGHVWIALYTADLGTINSPENHSRVVSRWFRGRCGPEEVAEWATASHEVR
jgi:hypothetical protein